MNTIIAGLILLFCTAALAQRKPRKLQPASTPLDNMEQQKKILLTRIRGMKFIEETRLYQFEIRDFVQTFLFHPDIGSAKEELKTELQMQVNELSIPTLIRVS